MKNNSEETPELHRNPKNLAHPQSTNWIYIFRFFDIYIKEENKIFFEKNNFIFKKFKFKIFD